MYKIIVIEDWLFFNFKIVILTFIVYIKYFQFVFGYDQVCDYFFLKFASFVLGFIYINVNLIGVEN